MMVRTAGRLQQIGLAAIPFALAFLTCGGAMAADVERQIPVTRDSAGSGITMEISREGTRQTATPILTLNHPTMQRFEERIAKDTARLAAKKIPSGTFAKDPVPGTGRTGTPQDDSGRPEICLSSLPSVPEEITVRSVKSFLNRMREYRKKTPVPAGVVAPPEPRLGRTGTSPHEAD